MIQKGKWLMKINWEVTGKHLYTNKFYPLVLEIRLRFCMRMKCDRKGVIEEISVLGQKK